MDQLTDYWNNLTLSDKARMIRLAVQSGLTDLNTIHKVYNKFADGGEKDTIPMAINEDGNLIDVITPSVVTAEAPSIQTKQGRRAATNMAQRILNTTKNVARRIVDSEARIAKTYSSKKYTFEEAYKDARSEGQKTFFWNGNYYNTDYEGTHGKQYKEDLASGKAQAFEAQYPNFTNPELRKEKQEELDTYGITNEQTKNKTAKDRILKKIPARGYDVNDAISGILGEHNRYSQYDTVEELISSLKKKYPQFKNVTLTGGVVTDINGNSVTYLDNKNIENQKPENSNNDLWTAFTNEIGAYDRFNRMSGTTPEIHRPELDYLLGYPTQQQLLYNNLGNTPIISKYKTGSEPYYYTTSLLEQSAPFIPKEFLDIKEQRKKVDTQMEELYAQRVHPNADALPEGAPFEKWHEAVKKDDNLPQNKKLIETYNNYLEERLGVFDFFIDKMENNKDYAKQWNDIGVYTHRGGLDIDYKTLIRSNASKPQIDTLGKMGAFDYIEPLNLTPGNHLAASGNDDYYKADSDYTFDKGKYDKFIKFINNSKEDHNAYNKEALNTKEYINSEPSLGVYTLSVPKDTSYVSVYDIFDINPFGSGNDKPIIKVGKPFEYYTRFYPEGMEPNIDQLYSNFAHGGYLNNLTTKPFSYTPIPQVRYDDGGFKNSVELTDSVDYPHTFTIYDLFGTKPTQINESPTLSKEQIVDLAWQAENPSNRGLNSDGTYSKYPDPSGKKDSKGNPLYDVGPGILVGTSISEKPFYTKAELDEGAYNYGLKGLSKIEKSYNEVYGNGEFNKVDPSLKLIMLDTRYRAGALPQAKYPNLYQAVHDRDTIKALQESRTTFIDGNNRKVPDNDRVRRLAEHLYPGMFDITFDSKGAHILKK